MVSTNWGGSTAKQAAALHELIDLASAQSASLEFRRQVLAWCERHVGSDQAAVGGPGDLQLTEHATSSDEVCVATCRMWQQFDAYAGTLAPLLSAARDQLGAVQDTAVLDQRAHAHRRFYREVIAPTGAQVLALAPLCVGGTVIGILGLGRARAGSSFGEDQLQLLGRAAQVIAMGDMLRRQPERRQRAAQDVVADLRGQLSDQPPLSPREREIVDLVTLGLTNAQVAMALGTSPNTVRKQLVSIFRKVQVASRAELVRAAMTEPLTSPAGGAARVAS